MTTLPGGSLLNQRLVTASLLVAILLASLFLPWDGLFSLLIMFMLGVSAWEWGTLAKLEAGSRRVAYVVGILALFLIALWFYDHITGFALRIATLVFWFWILLIPVLVRYPETEPLFQNRGVIAFLGGIILLSTACGLLWLKAQEHGAWLVLCLIAIVSIADSGAYFSGIRWGKNKLAPQISPGKTLEGLYGGLLANFTFAITLLFGSNMDPQHSFVIVFVILLTSLVSVEGDLLESAIKRAQGVKDSGTFLPGHGGVLDRIDGICAATPCFIFCVLFFSLG
jgi:phosphatidate cytidylyltransferase